MPNEKQRKAKALRQKNALSQLFLQQDVIGRMERGNGCRIRGADFARAELSIPNM